MMMNTEDDCAPPLCENDDTNVEITGLELLGYEDPDEHLMTAAAEPRKMIPVRAKSAPIFVEGDSDSASYASSTTTNDTNNNSSNENLGYGITRTDYGDRNKSSSHYNSSTTNPNSTAGPKRATSPLRGAPPMNLARVRRRVSIGNAEAGIMQTHWGQKPRRRASLTTTSSSQAAEQAQQQQPRVPRRQSLASCSSSGSSYTYAADSIDLRRNHQLQHQQQHQVENTTADSAKSIKKTKTSKATSTKKKKKKQQGKGKLERFFQNNTPTTSGSKSPPPKAKKQQQQEPPSPTKPMTDDDSCEDSYAKDSVMLKPKRRQQQLAHAVDHHDDSTCGSSYAKDSVLLRVKARNDDDADDDSSLDDSYAKDSVMLRAKSNEDEEGHDSSTCGSSYAKDSVMLRAKALHIGELGYTDDDSTCGSSYAKDSVVLPSKVTRPINDYDDDDNDESTCGDSYAKDSVLMKPKRKAHNDEDEDDDDSSCEDSYAKDSVMMKPKRQSHNDDDDSSCDNSYVKAPVRVTKNRQPFTPYRNTDDSDDSDDDTYANDSVMLPKKKSLLAASSKPLDKEDSGLGYNVPHTFSNSSPYSKRTYDDDDDDEDEEDSVGNDYLTNAVLGYGKDAFGGGPGSNQLAMRRESIDSVLTDCCSYAEDSVCGGLARSRARGQGQNDDEADDSDSEEEEEDEEGDDEDDGESVQNDYLTNAVLGYSKNAFDANSAGASIGRKAPRRESIDSDCCSYAQDSVAGGLARSRVQAQHAPDDKKDEDERDEDDIDINSLPNDPLMKAVMGYSKNAFGSDRQTNAEKEENMGSDYLMDAVMGYSKNAFAGSRGKAARRESVNSMISDCDSYAEDSVAPTAKLRPKLGQVVHVDAVEGDDDDASSLGYGSGYLSGMLGQSEPSPGRHLSLASMESDFSYACDSVAGPAKKRGTSSDPQKKTYRECVDSDDESMEEDPLDNLDLAATSPASRKQSGTPGQTRRKRSKDKVSNDSFESRSSGDLDPAYLEQVLGYSLTDFGGTVTANK